MFLSWKGVTVIHLSMTLCSCSQLKQALAGSGSTRATSISVSGARRWRAQPISSSGIVIGRQGRFTNTIRPVIATTDEVTATADCGNVGVTSPGKVADDCREPPQTTTVRRIYPHAGYLPSSPAHVPHAYDIDDLISLHGAAQLQVPATHRISPNLSTSSSRCRYLSSTVHPWRIPSASANKASISIGEDHPNSYVYHAITA